jgi:SAM-dependent methyltransferase
MKSRVPLPGRYRLWQASFDSAVNGALFPGASILDVGSGRQPTLGPAARPAGCNYVGLDLSETELALALPGSYDETIASDIAVFRPELRDRFDLVLSYQVFEHVRPLATALQNVQAYLKEGGTLVAAFSGTFAHFALASRVIPTSLARKIMQRTMGKNPEAVFPAHYDDCWYGALRSDLQSWSDAIVMPHYVGAYYFSFAPALQRLYLKYENWAARENHRNLATHYVIVARRPVAKHGASRDGLGETSTPIHRV